MTPDVSNFNVNFNIAMFPEIKLTKVRAL